MASKLCHDLVGPVGATANGAELLSDMTMEEEALALTAASANQAAKLLQYYRLAFGAAGGLRNDFDELRSVVAGMAELRGLEHSWDIDAGVDAPLGAAKLLANFMGLAAETLPRSGTLEGGVRREDGELVIFATARGPNAQLREEARGALDPAAAGEITPRSVQAYYAALLARQLASEVHEHSEGDSVALSARLPASG
ncbi:MAG: histidine phosphotransferase family protein [Rhodovibrionaceae bacterium]